MQNFRGVEASEEKIQTFLFLIPRIFFFSPALEITRGERKKKTFPRFETLASGGCERRRSIIHHRRRLGFESMVDTCAPPQKKSLNRGTCERNFILSRGVFHVRFNLNSSKLIRAKPRKIGFGVESIRVGILKDMRK